MTIKDLIKLIPEEHHDKIIEIYIPCVHAGNEGEYPLIEAFVNEDKKFTRIVLEADYLQ